MRKVLFIAAAVLSLTSCMIKTEKKMRTITVTGTGSVAVENKEAALEISVVSHNEDVVKASEENAERMTAVINAVMAEGVGNDTMHTSNYYIRQEETANQSSKKKTIQYTVSNRLHVTVKDISRTGKIIDAAIKAGANKMDSLSYSAGDTSEAEKQARILAVRDADQKANILVSTSGLKLGPVVNISEHEGGYYSTSNAVVRKADALMSTPISGGEATVNVTIDVTYELQ